MLPYVHQGSQTVCDFCQQERAQQFVFDVKPDVHTARSLWVCSDSNCNTKFEESKQAMASTDAYRSFDTLHTLVPRFSTQAWKVVRSNGDVEDGWHVSKSWKLQCDLGSLVRIRGEPWWRVPLVKNDNVKLILLQELQATNKDVFPPDIWDMIYAVFPAPAEPSSEFLQIYTASTFHVVDPTDAELVKYRK